MSTTYKEHTCTFPHVFNKRCWTAVLHIAFSSFLLFSVFLFPSLNSSQIISPPTFLSYFHIFSLKNKKKQTKENPKTKWKQQARSLFSVGQLSLSFGLPWEARTVPLHRPLIRDGLCAHLPFPVMGFCLVSFTQRELKYLYKYSPRKIGPSAYQSFFREEFKLIN